ncbi:MFS transporter [Plasticicumulans sp.]|uniref:MFS transporter n=1 Tax=Plasticicumulans sp. TaxID=2307179 RepID=UPI00393C70E1
MSAVPLAGTEPVPAAGTAAPAGLYGVQALRAMLGIALVAMLVALDQTVVGTAMPTIVAELRGFEQFAWVATAYLLSSTTLLPVLGRLGDLFGRKPFVIAAIIVFTGASALCGQAGSMPALIAARALQGVGGAMIIATAFTSIADLFPDTAHRLRWQALMSSSFALASGIGPVLGGLLTEHFGWRSVFYVNLPLGLLALVLVIAYLPRSRGTRAEGAGFDLPGALWLSGGLAALLLWVELGQRAGAWFAGALPLWLAGGVLALLLFVRRQLHARHPLLPLRLLAIPRVRRVVLCALAAGAVMFAALFYAPLLLQGAYGHSPHEAGLIVTPLVLAIALGSLINGRLYGRLADPESLLLPGWLLLGAGVLGVQAVGAQTSAWLAAGAFLLCGLGLGFLFPNFTLLVQTSVPRAELGVATALVQTVRALGSMAGTVVLGVLVTGTWRTAMDAAGSGAGAQALRPLFADPQLLLDPAGLHQATTLAARLPDGPAQLAQLLDAAHRALAAGIHLGLLLAAGLAALVLIALLAGRWRRRGRVAEAGT